MIIKNPNLLQEFRRKVRCEICCAPTQSGLQCHHVHTKGSGVLDIRCNLLATCLHCHQSHHTSNDPPRWQLIVIAARREGVEPEELIAVIHLLRRIPKRTSTERIEQMLLELTDKAAWLAKRELREAGVME